VSDGKTAIGEKGVLSSDMVLFVLFVTELQKERTPDALLYRNVHGLGEGGILTNSATPRAAAFVRVGRHGEQDAFRTTT
jgi:hypothetical protein